MVYVLTSWNQVLKSSDFSFGQLDLSRFRVSELTALFDQISSCNINHFAVLLFLAYDLLFFLLEQLLHVLLLKGLFELRMFKNVGKLAVMDNSLVLVNQINIWKSVIKTYNHIIYLILQFLAIFIFNLSFRDHLLNERVPIIE